MWVPPPIDLPWSHFWHGLAILPAGGKLSIPSVQLLGIRGKGFPASSYLLHCCATLSLFASPSAVFHWSRPSESTPVLSCTDPDFSGSAVERDARLHYLTVYCPSFLL